MSGEEIAAEILSVHARQHGVRCRGLSWQRWGESADELAEIAACLGGVALAAVCECFAEDYNGWHGGMPDLIVWQRRPTSADLETRSDEGSGVAGSGNASSGEVRSGATRSAAPVYGEARLVEVKSPSDKLSDQQRAWLHRLASRGVNVEVCRVIDDEITDTRALQPSFAPPEPLSQAPQPARTNVEPMPTDAAHSHLPTQSRGALENVESCCPPSQPLPAAQSVSAAAPTLPAAPSCSSTFDPITTDAQFGVYRLPDSARPTGSRLRLKRKST